MKIVIPKQTNSSITEEIIMELDNYTILAGENNSGKTNLIKAIKNHKDLKTYKKIFIPAGHIQPQDEETKNSVATAEFFKLLKIIFEPIFEKEILKELTKKFNNSEERKNFINSINKILKDFGVEKKEFDIKISEDKFNVDIIIKITKALVKDLYKTDVEYVDFENIGMGTQRLIVAALIQYYATTKIENSEKILIIFEEPEVYLHPRWKKSLHEALLKLSKKKNIIVLITTHDPYFIELSNEQKIYRVCRNSERKDVTEIIDMSIENKRLSFLESDSEINYQIFNIPSKAYFLEIYDRSKREAGYGNKKYKEFDKYMFSTYFNKKGIKQNCKDYHGNGCMAITELRHDIAHGKKNSFDLEIETENIIGFLKSII